MEVMTSCFFNENFVFSILVTLININSYDTYNNLCDNMNREIKYWK